MRRSKRNVILVLLLALLPLVSLSYYLVNPYEVRAYLAPWSGLRGMEAGVYVDPTMPAGDVESFRKVVQEARERVSGFFGGEISQPVVVASYSPACQEWYGRGAGVSRRGPLGASVVLSPKGENTDVLSHEWAHCEFARRVGLWALHTGHIPVWFDEGLAMQNDHRALYDTIAVEGRPSQEDLSSIASQEQFWSGGGRGAVWAYRLARQEVECWLHVVGKRGLEELLLRLKQGENFPELYSSIEQRDRENPGND